MAVNKQRVIEVLAEAFGAEWEFWRWRDSEDAAVASIGDVELRVRRAGSGWVATIHDENGQDVAGEPRENPVDAVHGCLKRRKGRAKFGGTKHWEVKCLAIDPKDPPRDEHLEEGWEPFAVTPPTQDTFLCLWLRRRVTSTQDGKTE